MSATTTLEVIIAGRDNFSGTVTKVLGGVKSLEAAAGRSGSAFSVLSGKLGHAKGAITGLLTGPLGVIGLTGGLFSLGGAVESSLHHTSDFSLGIEKLTTLTGESAQAMGSLLLGFEKFNVGADQTTQIVGFAEKTLGALAAGGGKKLLAFQKEFGISLVDNKGKVVDFTTELERVAAYYDSSATASEKAKVAATLFGRGYAAIIPILNLGAQGIADLSQTAKDLGLNLDATNVKQISDYRDSIRTLGESIGILQLKIGMALIPAVKGLADSISEWLSSGGADEIATFFKKGADFAQQFGHAIQTWVLPAFGLIGDAWSKVPGPLKDLLIGGFAINKASKFLGFGSIVGGVKGLAESVLGRVPGVSNVVGALDPGSRVFVTNWPIGFGGVGGAAGAAEGAAEGAAGAEAAGAAGGLTGIFSAVAAPIAAVAAVAAVGKLQQDAIDKQGNDLLAQAQGFASSASDAALANSIKGVKGQLDSMPFNSYDSKNKVVDVLNTLIQAQNARQAAKQMGPTFNGALVSELAKNGKILEANTRALTHAKAKAALGNNHDFLTAFRGVSAAIAIKDFPKELAYMSTVSDEQKKTPMYQRGLKDNIAALKRDMVHATTAQKVKLSSDIGVLQKLLKGTLTVHDPWLTQAVANGGWGSAANAQKHSHPPARHHIGGVDNSPTNLFQPHRSGGPD